MPAIDRKNSTGPRKALREATDALIHDALLIDDLTALVRMNCEAMLVVATTLVQYEAEPEVVDMVAAARTLIEGARGVMDRGLQLGDPETLKCGAVMIELTVRGMCAALSVPYDDAMLECYRAQQAGENPVLRPMLVEAGCLKALDDDRDYSSAGCERGCDG